MLKTTKIVVEESSSPEICGTFTFPKISQKSEITVEEVGSFNLNDHSTDILDLEERKLHKDVKKDGIPSLTNVQEDEMEELMERIKKQRDALNIIISEDKHQKDILKEDQKEMVEDTVEATELEPEETNIPPQENNENTEIKEPRKSEKQENQDEGRTSKF